MPVKYDFFLTPQPKEKQQKVRYHARTVVESTFSNKDIATEISKRCTINRADSPCDVLRYNDPDAGGYAGEPMSCLWETAWLDLGKAFRKRDFVLRFTAEADGGDQPVRFTVVTDRHEKEKVVLLQRGRRDYRVKIQNTGARVKLRIRSNSTQGWRIYGGVRVEYSVDEV